MELFPLVARWRRDDQGADFMATATSASGSRASATNGTTPADIEKQLETIRDDISELTHQVADLVGQTKDEAMAQVRTQARRAKAAADLADLGCDRDRARGGRRVPRRRRHVRRGDRGFAQAPALRDARGRRRDRLPVRRRLAALSGRQGGMNVRKPLGPAAGQAEPRGHERDLLRGCRRGRRDRAGVRHRGAVHVAR